MTSNIGSQKILQMKGGQIGEVFDRMKNAVIEDLRHHFRPEFLNRVDEIIVFHALTEANLKEIVEIQLGRLRERLAERQMSLELTDAAKSFLVKDGYDPTYGARPLKRTIQKEIENVLARMLLTGEVKDGQTIVADYDEAMDNLSFTAKA
jgi:ATP-dependent Clp protease ATP-binding subunit ClpB